MYNWKYQQTATCHSLVTLGRVLFILVHINSGKYLTSGYYQMISSQKIQLAYFKTKYEPINIVGHVQIYMHLFGLQCG